MSQIAHKVETLIEVTLPRLNGPRWVHELFHLPGVHQPMFVQLINNSFSFFSFRFAVRRNSIITSRPSPWRWTKWKETGWRRDCARQTVVCVRIFAWWRPARSMRPQPTRRDLSKSSATLAGPGRVAKRKRPALGTQFISQYWQCRSNDGSSATVSKFTYLRFLN